MSEEEIDVLYNEILKLPKVERPIPATTQCELNVDDLFDTIRAFKKIPDYNELINDNRKKDKRIEKQQQEIKRLNNIINELEKELKEDYKIWMCNSRSNGKSVKFGIDVCKTHFYNRLQELKGSDKNDKS